LDIEKLTVENMDFRQEKELNRGDFRKTACKLRGEL
jgi:hypothetical protein